jgi:hypothetical protein
MNKPKPTLPEQIDATLEDVRALRRMLVPRTLAEVAEWESEFGPNRTHRARVAMCKRLARTYGVPWREVEVAVPWMWDDGAVA